MMARQCPTCHHHSTPAAPILARLISDAGSVVARCWCWVCGAEWWETTATLGSIEATVNGEEHR